MSCLIRAVFRPSRGLNSTISRAPGKSRFMSTIGEESSARYCKGGYHPVELRDTFKSGRYKVLAKLGHGVYSTAWLAFDHKQRRHVALKILTADSSGHEGGSFEIDILKHLRAKGGQAAGREHILHLLDDFEHDSPHGKHVCLVTEAMGPGLSTYRRLFPGSRIPLHLMKHVSKQLLLALSYLHDTCQVIHTDIKPNNMLLETLLVREMFHKAPSEVFCPDEIPRDTTEDVVIKSTQFESAEEDLTRPTSFSVKLGDFGSASWTDKHLTEWIQPEKLRAPEVILGAGWNEKVDIWNLGLVVWELAEGKVLFDGCWTPQDDYTSETHLAQMVAIFCALPQHLLDRSKHRGHYVDDRGCLIKSSPFPPCSLQQFTTNIDIQGVATEQEKEDFLEFIGFMVNPDPGERPSASELLRSPWLAHQERLIHPENLLN